MGEVRGLPVPKGGIDTDERRLPHRWGREIPKGVVVGPLALATSDPEPTRRFGSEVPVGLAAPLPTERAVVIQLEAKRDVGGIEAEARQPRRGEVLGLVDLNQRAARFMQEVSGELDGVGGRESL